MSRKVINIYKLEDVLPKRIYYEGANFRDNVIIDCLLEKDLEEDLQMANNKQKIINKSMIIRYQKIVENIKNVRGRRCQICQYNFIMNNGKEYCEAHHIQYLSENGSQNPENVILLCPNHHRMFHYANEAIMVGDLINGKRKVRIGDTEYLINFV